MSLFDICPDIEGLIQDELNILLKFREATKEFKLRLKLNNKSMKKYKDVHRSCNSVSRIIIHSLFPYYGARCGPFREMSELKYKTENADIHGFKWSGIIIYSGWPEPAEQWGYNSPTHDDLNDKLQELGYKKFKSKKKQHKINLLLKH